MTICERIKLISNERGLSMYRIEKDCGLGNGSIMKWETSSPKVENIVKLADYLNVSVDYLLGRENQSQEKSLPVERPDSDISTIENIKVLMAENDGFDFIERLYKELEMKQKVFVISWLIGYMVSEGLPVNKIIGK